MARRWNGFDLLLCRRAQGAAQQESSEQECRAVERDGDPWRTARDFGAAKLVAFPLGMPCDQRGWVAKAPPLSEGKPPANSVRPEVSFHGSEYASLRRKQQNPRFTRVLTGGGRSPERTALRPKFPLSGKSTGNNRDLMPLV